MPVLLDNRLRSILAQIPLPDVPARTLSIGCGEYTETTLLNSLYPGWLHLGLDRNLLALQFATGIRVQAQGQSLPFACQFSLILIRHPDVALHPDSWAGIFAAIPRWLSKNGILLITCYSLEEWSFIRRCLPLPIIEVDLLALAPPDLVGRDRYVAIGSNL